MNGMVNIDDVSTRILQRDASMFQRDYERFEEKLDAHLGGARVLVIGAGGSIGAAVVMALVKFKLGELCIVDISENSLTEVVRDIRSSNNVRVPVVTPVVLDITSREFECFIRSNSYWDFVLNFAALKHVRSESDAFTMMRMLNVNALRPAQMVDWLRVGNKDVTYFSVSTDKATAPTNFMGATKLLKEHFLSARINDIKIKSTRFANVLFSQGSLPEAFLERLKKNQPLSFPRDINRYFISAREAANITLLACSSGESGDVFVPKLKPQDAISFGHIAEIILSEFGKSPAFYDTEVLAREATHNAGSDIWPCYSFISDTTGEKSLEEFHIAGAEVRSEVFEAIAVTRIADGAKAELDLLEVVTSKVAKLYNRGHWSREELVTLLTDLLPSFSHHETGKFLKDRM